MWQSKWHFSSGKGCFFCLVKKLDSDENMVKVIMLNL